MISLQGMAEYCVVKYLYKKIILCSWVIFSFNLMHYTVGIWIPDIRIADNWVSGIQMLSNSPVFKWHLNSGHLQNNNCDKQRTTIINVSNWQIPNWPIPNWQLPKQESSSLDSSLGSASAWGLGPLCYFYQNEILHIQGGQKDVLQHLKKFRNKSLTMQISYAGPPTVK